MELDQPNLAAAVGVSCSSRARFLAIAGVYVASVRWNRLRTETLRVLCVVGRISNHCSRVPWAFEFRYCLPEPRPRRCGAGEVVKQAFSR